MRYMYEVGVILLAISFQKRNCATVSVEVRKTQHKYIVGPRGQGLQEILQTSGRLATSNAYVLYMVEVA